MRLRKHKAELRQILLLLNQLKFSARPHKDLIDQLQMARDLLEIDFR